MADEVSLIQGMTARNCNTLDLARAEVDLRESELLFRALAENVEVVFYVHEIDQQRISYVSPAYERISGQSASEIYADPVAFLRNIHADDRPKVEIALTRQRAGENTETRYRLVMLMAASGTFMTGRL